jgi:hypothetical protein
MSGPRSSRAQGQFSTGREPWDTQETSAPRTWPNGGVGRSLGATTRPTSSADLYLPAALGAFDFSPEAWHKEAQ